jgi:hypothetical protein
MKAIPPRCASSGGPAGQFRPFPDVPVRAEGEDRQLVEAAGSNMDCLLKVIV